MGRRLEGTFLIAGGAAVTALLVVGCSGASSTRTPELKLSVVTTTTILADLARHVGGEAVEVRALAPPGADLHTFRLTPGDSVAISRARVIVSNGAGLDAWLEPALGASGGGNAAHVAASEGLEGQKMDADPHFWQNPLHAIHYVERIRDVLAQADPSRAAYYQENAAAYVRELRKLDTTIAETLEAVPSERRRLITSHDAFGYFGERYGWELTALVPHAAGDVTPRALAAVMERIENEGIPAVFAEPQFGEDVLRQAARDAGVSVGTIYSDALDASVPSYVEMMRFNARSLVEHLG